MKRPAQTAKTTRTGKAPRVALIVKRSSYRKFVIEAQDSVVTNLFKKRDPTIGRMKQSHEAHEGTIAEVEEALGELGATIVHRSGPHSLIHGKVDLVVTVGGDGTLLDASHMIGADTPLLGINSAPTSSVGFFCGGIKGEAKAALARALAAKLPSARLARMTVELNGKVLQARVLNEALFCHASPAATSRYILELPSGQEDQRSSGLWIGPAAGSTAAQKSAGGKVLPLESSSIQYVVREPYTAAGGKFRWARGLIKDGQELVLRSKMHDARVFLDGNRLVFNVTMGDVLVMRRSDEPLTVLGISKKRRS